MGVARENKRGGKHFLFAFRDLGLNVMTNWSNFNYFHVLNVSVNIWFIVINNVTVLQWKLMFLTLYENYKHKRNDFYCPNHDHI